MTKKFQQDSGGTRPLFQVHRRQLLIIHTGVLKYHNAVCVGYATTFRMFMQMMGIECKVEHNTEKFHSWDVVKIDGDWYITDIYSRCRKLEIMRTLMWHDCHVLDTVPGEWGLQDNFDILAAIEWNMEKD